MRVISFMDEYITEKEIENFMKQRKEKEYKWHQYFSEKTSLIKKVIEKCILINKKCI